MEGQALAGQRQVTVHRPKVPYTPLSPASTTSPSAWNNRRATRQQQSAVHTGKQPCASKRAISHLVVCAAAATEAPPQTFGDGAVAKVYPFHVLISAKQIQQKLPVA